MKISVVIVNYNVKYYLEQCLLSLRKSLEGIDSEVFVVDNHSRDGSVEYLHRRFREVHFVASRHNLGFARANNYAIKRAKGEYVLLLNPDTILCENTIGDCLAFMDDNPKAGALGVKMLKCNGEKAMESRRGLPTPAIAFYKMCGLCARYPKSRRFGKYYMSYLSWDEPARIEVVSGAFCLLRRTAIDEVGMLDESFFMYGEDIDLSYRILKGGFENWYLPVPILHYKGESTKKSSFRYVHVFYEAMLIFFKKHYGHLRFWITLPIKMAIYFKAFVALVGLVYGEFMKMLGLVSRHRGSEPGYVFISSRHNIASCKRIANNNGLDAYFVECNDASNYSGHGDFAGEFSLSLPYYYVYDTSVFSNEQILSLFENSSHHDAQLGMYYPKTHKVIIDKEVLHE